MEQDKGRSLKYDSFINRVNIHTGYMKSKGKDVLWGEELGETRKRIGDFACYVGLIWGLSAR